jgi:hypothetical protein
MERDFETKPCVSAETNHGRRLHRLHVLLAARPAEHSSRHVACYQPCLGWGRGRMEPGPRACGTANRRLPRRQRQRRLHASGSAGSTTRRRAAAGAMPGGGGGGVGGLTNGKTKTAGEARCGKLGRRLGGSGSGRSGGDQREARGGLSSGAARRGGGRLLGQSGRPATSNSATDCRGLEEGARMTTGPQPLVALSALRSAGKKAKLDGWRLRGPAEGVETRPSLARCVPGA